MIALIQRVARASVTVEGRLTGEIGAGLLALVCAERGDGEAECERLVGKLLGYRVFSDDAGKMNRSLMDIDGHGTSGGLLVVSQFTLAADTNSGTRPSFTPAASPEVGRRLYEHFVDRSRAVLPCVQTGEFGAAMQVSLVNDGPVTFWLRVAPPAPPRAIPAT